MTENTSARIAADLRARIAAGEFAPGERVPSTRELVRQWGVAMATATRALTALQDEGLLRPVRGVGTVVAARPTAPRPARRRTPGSSPARNDVVRTAMAVADAEGLATLSMRRVAAELGIPTMSLYQHVASKDELVTLMIDSAFGEEPLPEQPPGWRAALETAARVQWTAYRRHPWLAPAMSITRPQAVPGALAYTEWVLAALDGRGLDATTAFTIHIMLFSYVRGMAVNLEAEEQAAADSGMTADEWMDVHVSSLESLVAGGGFPHVTPLLELDFDLDLDALFELGLRCLLDGLHGVLP